MAYNGFDDWRVAYVPLMETLDGNHRPIEFDEDWDRERPTLDPWKEFRAHTPSAAAPGGLVPPERQTARGEPIAPPRRQETPQFELNLPGPPEWKAADRVPRARGVDPGRRGGSGQLFDMARSFLGAPYVFGTAGPQTFDCSGFTKYLFNRVLGVNLPHQAKQQAQVTKSVRREDLKPGDLLFFRYGRLGGDIDHVEVYLGNGKMIGTSNPTEDLDIDNVDWSHFVQGGRVPGARRAARQPSEAGGAAGPRKRPQRDRGGSVSDHFVSVLSNLYT
jgi:cell wall-associated NlpC family hydrolase